MDIMVRNTNVVEGTLCITLAEQTLFCGTLPSEGVHLQVLLPHTDVLRVYQDNVVIFERTLHRQIASSPNKRRRIRLPWSLF